METDLSAFARAMADETRLRIMNLICCRQVSVGDLVTELGNVSQPTVSHHLQVLRNAGLVETRREGKQVFYTLKQQVVAQCCTRLAQNYAPEIDLSAVVHPNDEGDAG